jgi:hypothetical protein
MFGLFRRGTLLGTDLTEAQFDCFAWLLRHTGGMGAFRERRAIFPTPEFYRHEGARARDHTFAHSLFDQTRAHAGMQGWPCQLEAQEDDPDPLVGKWTLVKGAPQGPGGTWRATEDGALITYHPKRLGDPMSLVATFAHELAHYRTAGFPEPPPGGWEAWEDATDLAAVFLGFGVFLANTRFQFSQFAQGDTQGWQWRRQGYLSEPEILHMHAIFVTLLQLPPTETLRHLKPSLRGIFKRTLADVRKAAAELDALRRIGEAAPA